MAKKTQNVGMVEAGTLPSQIIMPGGFHISLEGLHMESFAIVAGGLGLAPKGLFYAIQYGLSQSLQDSVAGLAKSMREAVFSDEDEAKGLGIAGEAKFNDAEIAAGLHDAMRERLEAIASGDIGHRTRGPQVRGVDKVIRDVAWEAIVAQATSLGKAQLLPKKSADINGLVDKYLADDERAASAKAEAERRMGAVKPMDTSFLDELTAV